MMQFGPLSDRQRKLVSFIISNPGLTKNKLRQELPKKGVGSYVTINKDITELEELEIIKFRREKGEAKNSPIQCYFNHDSELAQLDRELNTLQQSFSKLMLKILRRYFELWPPRASSDAEMGTKVREQIIAIMNQIIYKYVFKATTVWPLEITDLHLLEKMFAITFSRLAAIRQDSLMTLGPGMSARHSESYVRQMQQLFTETIDSSTELKKFCAETGLEKDFQTVSTILKQKR